MLLVDWHCLHKINKTKGQPIAFLNKLIKAKNYTNLLQLYQCELSKHSYLSLQETFLT